MKPILVDEDELANYLFSYLIQLGYVPEEDELEDIAMGVMDYLEEQGMDMDYKEEE